MSDNTLNLSSVGHQVIADNLKKMKEHFSIEESLLDNNTIFISINIIMGCAIEREIPLRLLPIFFFMGLHAGEHLQFSTIAKFMNMGEDNVKKQLRELRQSKVLFKARDGFYVTTPFWNERVRQIQEELN